MALSVVCYLYPPAYFENPFVLRYHLNTTGYCVDFVCANFNIDTSTSTTLFVFYDTTIFQVEKVASPLKARQQNFHYLLQLLSVSTIHLGQLGLRTIYPCSSNLIK